MSRERHYGPRKYPVDLNIRLAPPKGTSPTKDEIREVLREIIDDGTVPRGWQFAAISWRNPDKATKGWLSGNEEDLQEFKPVLRKMGIQYLLKHFRVAAVRKMYKRRKPTKREKQKLERMQDRRADVARERKQALRAVERSKRKETRDKWKKQAKELGWEYAELNANIEEALDAMAERQEEEVAEYEIAASYGED